jgi:SAM-dependent methyltransferase
MGKSLDTQAIGLDVGLGFVKWLTGAENLHYGLWDGLDVSAANLGAAQAAYTDKLFALLPEGSLRILDVGGGAGETARKLQELGHTVEIVIPSPLLAAHCRANAPGATVHLARFEDATPAGPFDLCLFSESFQYIPLHSALQKARDLVRPGGTILIADCFRSPAFRATGRIRVVGGGHHVMEFRAALSELGLDTLHDEDITASVAPSIDLEAGLFRVFGHAVTRVDEELSAKRPTARWTLVTLLRTLLGQRRSSRILGRLDGEGRTSEAFLANNVYLMVKLRVPGP